MKLFFGALGVKPVELLKSEHLKTYTSVASCRLTAPPPSLIVTFTHLHPKDQTENVTHLFFTTLSSGWSPLHSTPFHHFLAPQTPQNHRPQIGLCCALLLQQPASLLVELASKRRRIRAADGNADGKAASGGHRLGRWRNQGGWCGEVLGEANGLVF